MNRRLAAAVIAAGLLATLTGCSTPSETTTSSAPVEATVEPLSVDTEPPKVSADDADVEFLAAVRERVQTIKSATDEQLIDGGHRACEQATSGTGWQDIRVIDGEVPDGFGTYFDSGVLAYWGITYYCTEFAEQLP